jgi:hypothetical protein
MQSSKRSRCDKLDAKSRIHSQQRYTARIGIFKNDIQFSTWFVKSTAISSEARNNEKLICSVFELFKGKTAESRRGSTPIPKPTFIKETMAVTIVFKFAS